MTYTLIKTDNSLILVSDEEIKDCNYLVIGINNIQHTNKAHPSIWNNKCKKVLSQSPKLNKKVIDEIGWIDVEELVKDEIHIPHNQPPNVSAAYEQMKGFKKGFQKAQELNQKKYTEKDIRDAYAIGRMFGQWETPNSTLESKPSNIKEYIQSLSQPQQWQVEVKEIDGQWNVTKIIK